MFAASVTVAPAPKPTPAGRHAVSVAPSHVAAAGDSSSVTDPRSRAAAGDGTCREPHEPRDEGGGGAGEPCGKSPPQAARAHVELEREDERDRQADGVVAEEIGDERGARVSGAAQRTGGDGLRTVGELE